MLYDAIKALCQKKGVTVGALEKELRFSNGLVSKWNESEPTVGNAKKVADFFAISLEELLSMAGEKTNAGATT